MKVFYVFINFFIFVGTISCSSFLCPLNSNLEPIDGTFKDPLYCNIYYQCVKGTPYSQSCPPGLFFRFTSVDCEYVTCVDPEFANCKSNLTRELNEFEKSRTLNHNHPVKTNECGPNKNTTVPSKGDCRVYYHCVNGVGWPQQCPSGYFFNMDVNIRDCNIRMCVEFEDSNCPIAGGWSDWSSWSDCEPVCGGDGIQTRTRNCNNPPPANGGAECPGSAIDLRICNTPDCENFGDPAFMVSLQRTQIFRSERVNWTSIDINNGKLFNPLDNTVNISSSGMYFFSKTVTIGDQMKAVLKTKNTGRDFGLGRNPEGYSINMMNRASIFSLTSLYKPYVQHDLPRGALIGSDIGKETSWLGFRYNSDNYFFATTQESRFGQGDVSLPVTLSLRGFSSNGIYFRPQESGYYFIHYGIGTHPAAYISVTFAVDYFHQTYFKTIKAGEYSSSIDHLSRGVIRYVERGQAISLLLLSGSYGVYSDSNLQTYLSAFKLNSTQPMMFGYGSRNPCQNDEFRKYTLQDKYLDNTNSWNTTNNSYTSKANGIYYVELNLSVQRLSRVEVFVEVNGIKQFRLIQLTADHESSELVTKSGLVKMVKNDILTITYKGCLDQRLNMAGISIFLASAV